jgi:hypothetical protein
MDVLFGSMQRIGLRATWLVAGLLAAALPAVAMWGFTVDDALIAVRYARNLAQGLGWRFDAGGPPTDGVTPLPWPGVLLLLGGTTPLAVLHRAQGLGLLVWAAAGAALGYATGGLSRSPVWVRVGMLLVLALSVPVAAHAVSGMETALAMSLATFAALAWRRPLAAAVLSGLAASLRPEMAPWAIVLSSGFAVIGGKRARAVGYTGIALVPFLACAMVRVIAWGRPAPLALFAKPPDASLGMIYAGAGVVVALTPLLVVAPRALRRTPPAMVIVLAASAHLLSIVVVGGDWMPYARLMAPVAPSLAWAALLASENAGPVSNGARIGALAMLGAVLAWHDGLKGRRVGEDRETLIRQASREIGGYQRVASLDVGWVGASTPGDVIDLAGTTDPRVAALPGGHLTKRVDATFLLELRADALLLYVSARHPEVQDLLLVNHPAVPPEAVERWWSLPFERTLERKLAADEVVRRHFTPVTFLPLGRDGAGYVLFARDESAR